MAEPSNKNPEKVISFKVHPANKLFDSIRSLCDYEFNPKGMGRVDITEKGFEITVRNAETDALGNVFLRASGLINFHCSKPIVGKMINVTHIYLLVNDATEKNATVTVFQVEGSNNLTFIHESYPDNEHNVELLELNPEIQQIPSIKYFCEAVLTSENLRDMIEILVQRENPVPVSVDIAERFVAVFIEGHKPWIYKYETEKIVGTRGMEPGQMHHAWFIMRHMEALWKASYLAPCFLMCLTSEPANTVMKRFNLGELGDFVFISKTEDIVPNSNEAVVALKLLQDNPDPYLTI